jgi:NAD(P)H-hydrate epimerase
MKILSAQQIKACDQYTMISEPISSIDLMNRAATCLFEFIQQTYSFQKYTIVCGSGNNGGDGLVIAQLLFKNNVEVNLIVLKGTYTEECLSQLNNARELNIPIVEIDALEQIDHLLLLDETCIIDALFGIGISRPIEGLASVLIQKLNACNCYKLAIDLPSGLSPDCNFESNQSNTIIANETLTIQLPKLAFMFPENDAFVGKFHMIDIGLSQSFIESQSDTFEYIDEKSIEKSILPRPSSAHKGTFGHALLIAGSPNKIGASIISAKATLRSGCGMLTVLLPTEGSVAMNSALPEAMLLTPQHSNKIEFEKYGAIAVGPGLGTSIDAVKLVKDVLNNYTQPLVIDADALNILALNPELMETLNAHCILTPHPIEFDRLTKEHSTTMQRFIAQKEFATKYKVNIVLKGHHTCIVTSEGKVYFNSNGNNGMSTAGSGDALTGILLGLCAQKYPMDIATYLGVFVHGYAGDLAAFQHSKTALIASDIVNSLGEFFKRYEKA